MTPKKKNPAKRGRKPKAPGEKVEQLTIRLSPKLKLGLDLLARAQHRSISQVVEWALQVGLNAYQVNHDGASLDDVLDQVWSLNSEGEQAQRMYELAPALLSFEDFSTCDMVSKSIEAVQAFEQFSEREARREAHESLREFVSRKWDDLHIAAIERTLSGKPLANLSLADLAGIPVAARQLQIDAVIQWVKHERQSNA